MDDAGWRDIEEIKQLKARYCRLLDTKDWASWRSVPSIFLSAAMNSASSGLYSAFAHASWSAHGWLTMTLKSPHWPQTTRVTSAFGSALSFGRYSFSSASHAFSDALSPGPPDSPGKSTRSPAGTSGVTATDETDI